jgi:hypothetical protein
MSLADEKVGTALNADVDPLMALCLFYKGTSSTTVTATSPSPFSKDDFVPSTTRTYDATPLSLPVCISTAANTSYANRTTILLTTMPIVHNGGHHIIPGTDARQTKPTLFHYNFSSEKEESSVLLLAASRCQRHA